MKENVRLIDENEVIKVVDKHTKDCPEIVLDNDISCILEEVPTAYDVDKVMEQLEEKLTEVENELDNLKNVCTHILLAEREHLLGRKIAYATVIGIVRGMK